MGGSYSEFRNTEDFIGRRSVITDVASQWERFAPYEVVVYASSEVGEEVLAATANTRIES
jgi:hypothetical protein